MKRSDRVLLSLVLLAAVVLTVGYVAHETRPAEKPVVEQVVLPNGQKLLCVESPTGSLSCDWGGVVGVIR